MIERGGRTGSVVPYEYPKGEIDQRCRCAFGAARTGSRALVQDGGGGAESDHVGPDASLDGVVPDGTAWARFDVHAFTVAHDETFVSDAQRKSTVDVSAWARGH